MPRMTRKLVSRKYHPLIMEDFDWVTKIKNVVNQSITLYTTASLQFTLVPIDLRVSFTDSFFRPSAVKDKKSYGINKSCLTVVPQWFTHKHSVHGNGNNTKQRLKMFKCGKPCACTSCDDQKNCIKQCFWYEC